MARTILILGGARSGKSRFAQQLARRIGGDEVLFVATAAAGDAEMARRIKRHRADRPDRWHTLEQTADVGAAIAGAPLRHRVVIIDCLTLLVSNVLLACPDPLEADVAEDRIRAEVTSLLTACRGRPGTVIIVSGEVGQGLVPDNPLGRIFRDLAGMANQTVAAASDSTYLMVAGLPVDINALASTVATAAATGLPPAEDHESPVQFAREIDSR
jgi:adenosyl cobinamide kinase/adenosyl cobinamide phosphate guanylyltransferase